MRSKNTHRERCDCKAENNAVKMTTGDHGAWSKEIALVSEGKKGKTPADPGWRGVGGRSAGQRISSRLRTQRGGSARISLAVQVTGEGQRGNKQEKSEVSKRTGAYHYLGGKMSLYLLNLLVH